MKCATGDLQNAAARAERCERFPVLGLLLILQLCWEMQWDSKCHSPTALQGGMQVARPFSLHYALKLDNKQDLISVTENPKQVLALLQPFLQRLAVTDMQQLHRAGSCAFCGLLPLESHVLDEARDKHHYLKICGCFTYTVYSPTLPPG